jgi:hypothetical protein
VEPARARPLAVALPPIRYAPAPSDKPAPALGREAVSPMSPLLFAVPTRQGFSGSTWDEKVGAQPPLAPLVTPRRWSKRIVRQSGATPALWAGEADWKSEVESVLRAFPMKLDAAPAFVVPPPTGRWVEVQLSGVLEGVRLTLDDLPEWPPELRTQAWDAVVFMDIADGGSVRHLLFEQRSPSELFNEQLDRCLRGRVFSETRHAGAGRLRIRAMGVTPGEAAVERSQP